MVWLALSFACNNAFRKSQLLTSLIVCAHKQFFVIPLFSWGFSWVTLLNDEDPTAKTLKLQLHYIFQFPLLPTFPILEVTQNLQQAARQAAVPILLLPIPGALRLINKSLLKSRRRWSLCRVNEWRNSWVTTKTMNFKIRKEDLLEMVNIYFLVIHPCIRLSVCQSLLGAFKHSSWY